MAGADRENGALPIMALPRARPMAVPRAVAPTSTAMTWASASRRMYPVGAPSAFSRAISGLRCTVQTVKKAPMTRAEMA